LHTVGRTDITTAKRKGLLLAAWPAQWAERLSAGRKVQLSEREPAPEQAIWYNDIETEGIAGFTDKSVHPPYDGCHFLASVILL
jgi:hypothetical protein